MQKSIQLIDLRGNHLQSLPSELFLPLLVRNDVKISLSQNQWHCDCELLPLRQNLLNSPSHFEYEREMKCATPDKLIEQPITSAVFCSQNTDKAKDENCTDQITEKNDTFLRIRCLHVAIERPKIKFKVTKNVEKTFLTLEFDNVFPHLVLFAFHSKTNLAIKISPNINTKCWTRVKHLMKIPITDIQDRYVFCLWNQTSHNMIPLNCQTFITDDTILTGFQNDKVTVISYVIVVFITCIIVMLLCKCNQRCDSSPTTGNSSNGSDKSRLSVDLKSGLHVKR